MQPNALQKYNPWSHNRNSPVGGKWLTKSLALNSLAALKSLVDL